MRDPKRDRMWDRIGGPKRGTEILQTKLYEKVRSRNSVLIWAPHWVPVWVPQFGSQTLGSKRGQHTPTPETPHTRGRTRTPNQVDAFSNAHTRKRHLAARAASDVRHDQTYDKYRSHRPHANHQRKPTRYQKTQPQKQQNPHAAREAQTQRTYTHICSIPRDFGYYKKGHRKIAFN